MPDHLSSATEQFEPAAMRAEICQHCHDDRDALSALVLADTVHDRDEHEAELAAWLPEHLPDCEPIVLALAACLQIEADEAAAGFPAFRVDELDPVELREEVRAFIAEQNAFNRNENATGEIGDGVPTKIPIEVGQESTLLQHEKTLTTENAALTAAQETEQTTQANQLGRKTDKQERNTELSALQPRFLQMLSEGLDSTAALQQVIAEAESLETKQHLNALLHRLAALIEALPGKATVIQSMLRMAPLDLAAPTAATSFAGFMAMAESSPDFSDDDREVIRQVIKQTDHDMRTGTKIYNAALTTTIDPATGETVPLHPADRPAEVLPGVQTFTETGQNVILEMRTDNQYHRLDVTGFDGVTIGLIAESMAFAAECEAHGGSGFVQDVYGLKNGLLTGGQFDPLSLIGFRQRLNALMAGNQGYNGAIFDPAEQMGLIRDQMRLTSPTNSADSWQNDRRGGQARAKALGLHHPIVLREFGRYTQLYHGRSVITPTALQQHLYTKFPDLVTSPNSVSSDR